jgi:uncharacterized membrane protein
VFGYAKAVAQILPVATPDIPGRTTSLPTPLVVPPPGDAPSGTGYPRRVGGNRVLALLLLTSVLCCATEEARVAKTGDSFYRLLVWNLALAWVPLLLALAAYRTAMQSRKVETVALAVAWILFFPNAPYVLTDFVHLGNDGSAAPLWYDALMIASFAWTALLIGLGSLYVMQVVVRDRLGAAWSWLLVAGALLLGSFGVYLGRFVRFNSWDALVRPGRVAHVIATQLENPIHHPRLIGALVVLTAFLTVAYAILYAIAGLELGLRSTRPGARGSRAPAGAPGVGTPTRPTRPRSG